MRWCAISLRRGERRDIERVLEYFTEDAVYHAMPLQPIAGKAALSAWVRGFAGVPPAKLDVRHQLARGTAVMNERVDALTLNGCRVPLPICATFEIRDGRISAWREYFDLAPAKAAFATAPAG